MYNAITFLKGTRFIVFDTWCKKALVRTQFFTQGIQA